MTETPISRLDTPYLYKQFIDGQWVASEGERRLPAGVLSLLHGDSEGISRHPGIDKVSFTGSNRVGEAVMRAASATTKGISLELGGKSPILVMGDADPQ